MNKIKYIYIYWLFFVLPFFLTHHNYAISSSIMDFLVVSRLLDTVVYAQKEVLSFNISNMKKVSLYDKSRLYYYRGLCNLYFDDYFESEKDFHNALINHNANDYILYKKIAIALQNKNKRYELIKDILKKNNSKIKEVYCRLKYPNQLKYLVEKNKNNKIQFILEDCVLNNNKSTQTYCEKNFSALISEEKINNLYLYDPFTLFYLTEIYNNSIPKKELKFNYPNVDSQEENDYKYLYINYIVKKINIDKEIKEIIYNKYKGSIFEPVFDMCFIMNSNKPNYEKAFSSSSQHVYKYPLSENCNPERVWILFYIDFAVSSYHVNNFHWAYDWIITLKGIEDRYYFIKIAKYYMGWLLYNN